ncbi:uncharacterized protein N7496_012026 [Penicillium cataractarum]|uniref:Uncharacterized protein n=1 Tax=Penicillium cataractarum TaxID=2100454 RepID=A0A9W9RG20_9EURO|nr:uncharacterized protein N7496_012026 [Penicillium cataractarum]KAJ5359613.1 hypothetical protein N7496_012026 [Penicillium cataractarum]
MVKKKTNTKKNSRPSAHAVKSAEPTEPAEHAEPPEDGEEILTQEELLERIRKARAAKAGVEYQPPPPQPKKKGPVKPFIPLFDPNLPPAAFPSLPTIGQPIPTGTREGHLRRVKEDRERRLQGLDPLPRESYHPGPIFRISGQDDEADINESKNQEPAKNQDPADANEVDAEYEAPDGANVDWEARNTELNVVYMRNMAHMAGSGQKKPAGSNDLDLANRLVVEFSDSEVETEQESRVPEWGDLTQSLQVEILDNLLEKYTWEDVVNRLGLSRKQDKKAREYLDRYHKVLEREDEELKNMRDKQLQFLMKLDCTNDRNVPKAHILGRIAKEYQSKIANDPEQKFLKYKTRDVRAAWQILEKRGLSKELAGDCGNGIEILRLDEDDEPVAKRVKRSHPVVTTEGSSIMPMNSCPTEPLSLAEKTAAINNVCQGSSIALPVDTVHPMQTLQKHWDDWEQLFTEPDENQAHLARERRLQLALGKDGAAAIMADQDGPTLPEPPVTQYRYNQRIEQAKLDSEAEKRAAGTNGLPFTARDITEGTWEQKLEARYQKLANDCQKLFLSYDSRPDVEYEENSELDEDALEELLEEAGQFNENLRGLLKDGSNSRSADPDVNME